MIKKLISALIIAILLICSIVFFSPKKLIEEEEIDYDIPYTPDMLEIVEDISLPMPLFKKQSGSKVLSNYVNITSIRAFEDRYAEHKYNFDVDFTWGGKYYQYSNLSIYNGSIAYSSRAIEDYKYPNFYSYDNGEWKPHGNSIYLSNATILYIALYYSEKGSHYTGYFNHNRQIIILDQNQSLLYIGVSNPVHYFY